MKPSTKKRVLITASCIFIFLLAYFGFVFFISPSGPLPVAVRPTFKKIPDSENAWLEYQRALDVLKETDNAKTVDGIRWPDWLKGWITNLPAPPTPLVGDHDAYVDQRMPAFSHMVAAA